MRSILHKFFNRKPKTENLTIIKLNAKEIAFVHINKTAGTSIINSLGIKKKNHLTAKDLIAKIGKERWRKAFKFTVVRNPWDKVHSHYKYRVKTNQTGLRDSNLSFKDWVLFTYGSQRDPKYYDNPKMFLPQVEWIKNDEGIVDMDAVLKFENLATDFKMLTKRLKVKWVLPHLNKTKATNYKDYYDEETKSIIEDYFVEDIKTFEYTF